MVDYLAECYANEDMSKVWIPWARAKTERGAKRVLGGFLRQMMLSNHDVIDMFDKPYTLKKVYAVVRNEHNFMEFEPRKRLFTSINSTPITRNDKGAKVWWQFTW